MLRDTRSASWAIVILAVVAATVLGIGSIVSKARGAPLPFAKKPTSPPDLEKVAWMKWRGLKYEAMFLNNGRYESRSLDGTNHYVGVWELCEGDRGVWILSVQEWPAYRDGVDEATCPPANDCMPWTGFLSHPGGMCGPLTVCGRRTDTVLELIVPSRYRDR